MAAQPAGPVVVAFIRIFENRRHTLFRIPFQDVLGTDLHTQVAAIAHFFIKNNRSEHFLPRARVYNNIVCGGILGKCPDICQIRTGMLLGSHVFTGFKNRIEIYYFAFPIAAVSLNNCSLITDHCLYCQMSGPAPPSVFLDFN
jgi:hypothetical protein